MDQSVIAQSQLARLNYDLYHTTSAIETATVAANVFGSLK
jgi:hypothetical protein